MQCKAISSKPGVLGGTPVFAGTRVPVRILMEYLEAGDSLADFLDNHPSVARAQAVEVLAQAKAAPAGIRIYRSADLL